MIQLASFYRASRAAAKAGALALPPVTHSNPRGLGFSELLQLSEEEFVQVSSLIEGERYPEARRALGLIDDL